MSPRKFVAREAIDSLLGDSKQAMVVLLWEQGDGCATDLEQVEDHLSRSLETLLKDVAG